MNNIGNYNEKRKRQPILVKGLMILLVFVGTVVSYILYTQFYAAASVSGYKYLTANGTAINAVTNYGGSYADTTQSAGDNVRWDYGENSDIVDGLSRNFTGWNPLNTATEATGPKVTQVTVNMEAAVGNSSWSGSGNKTFQFKMYNYSNSTYDLTTTATRQLTSTTDAIFSLSFPSGQDYTNYFDTSGNFQIQLDETADGDGSNTRIRIDYINVQIYYDNTAPVATWSSPSGNPLTYYTSAASIDLTAAGTDNSDAQQTGISSMDYFYGAGTFIGSDTTPNTGTTSNGTWIYTWSPAEGSYSVYASAVDGKSNTSANTATQTIVVDRAAPTATIVSPAASAKINGTYAITGTANDTNINTWTIQRSPAGAGTWTNINTGTANVNGATLGSWNTTLVTDGDYDIRLTVTDMAGNSTTTTASGVVVDNTAPTFSINYYSDAGLTTVLSTYNSKPITKVGVPIYIKVTPNETLTTAPTISIAAPGTLNDRSNVTAALSGGNYVYTWNVVSDTDGDANITVSGTDTVGNAASNVTPTSGGTVTLDSNITIPTLSATSGGNLVDLSWTTQSDDKQYAIYRSTTNGFTPDGSNLVTTVTATASSYSDTGLTEGVTYYYKIVLTDYAGNVSNPSNQVSGVPTKALLETDKVDFTSIKGGNNQINLTWSDPGGADYFELQRSTDGENFTVITSGASLTAYTDNTVQNYVNYYYKVLAKASTLTVVSEDAHAFPPDTSPHGHYANNSSLCASCHITHAAQGSNLIKEASKTTLCTSCHDGTLSKYNVLKGEVRVPDAGYYAQTSAGLFGLLDTGVGAVNTSSPYNYTKGVITAGSIPVNPTSIHNLGTIISDAPGENINVVESKDTVLECNTCHDPHNTSNFRMLKLNLNTSNSEAVNDVKAYAKTVVNVGANNDTEVVTYRGGSINFCGYCHSDFNQSSGSGHKLAKSTMQSGFEISNDSYDKVMHAVGVSALYSGNGGTKPSDIPYENDGVNGDIIMCLTCHRAHGTTAIGTINRRNAQQSTVLKRKDDALLCEGCHDKTNNP